MRKYFSPDYVIQSAGSVVYGLPGLAYYTYSTMLAFPDIKIKILDCFCKGNDIYGYRCSMPDILMGTNTGPSLYGAPTGKFVKYTGLVNSFIQNVDGRWVYMMEYGNHDVVTLLRELGFENLPPERPAEDYIQFVDNERCENWMTFFKREQERYSLRRQEFDEASVQLLAKLHESTESL